MENSAKIKLLLDIWEEICGCSIDPKENYFTYGMDSILLSRFNEKILSITDKEISVADLFYCSTIEEIAEII